MNEQAGPACALSVLIVGVFAVLLHDRDRGTPTPKPSLPSIAREVSRPPAPKPAIPGHSRAPEIETGHVATTTGVGDVGPRGDRSGPGKESGPPGGIAAIDPPAPKREPAPVPKRSTRPRGDFTVVEPGETLADVARRVYGSIRSAESLWKANRDQLASLESPLEKGTLLRTP